MLTSLLCCLPLAIAEPVAKPGEGSCCSKPGRASMIVAAQPAPTNDAAGKSHKAPEGMVWIPAGEFTMGSTDPLARPDEAPVHRVRLDGFWMDVTEVTNRQFAKFVAATGYKTVAERPVDWNELKKQLPEGTPKPDEKMLLPGSLVFTPPNHPVDLEHYELWWSWTTGADWRHPEGPNSSIDGKDEWPVVHVAYEDALAYCAWAKRSLPTEAQWEYAARGGLDHAVNVWGNEPVDPTRCNTWQGHFPNSNTAQDGYPRAAPVKRFPANGYGLHDMAGNVWEWCRDLYRPDTYARQQLELDAAGKHGVERVIINPTGPMKSFDPRNPDAPESRVQRGGSFLCNDSYCASYRPSARMACPPDTGMQHVGFRCIISGEACEALDASKPAASSSGHGTPSGDPSPARDQR